MAILDKTQIVNPYAWGRAYDGLINNVSGALLRSNREGIGFYTAYGANAIEQEMSFFNNADALDWWRAGSSKAIDLGTGIYGGTTGFGSVTTTDGFLFGKVTFKTPIDIPVQRFGNMSIARSDFWGARIGTNPFVNRTFAAIKTEWNPLTQYTSGVIPKGTRIQFGIIGPQGLRYPGGSFQFVVNSKSVINQSSKAVN